MPRQRREVPWLEPHDNGTYYIHWYDAEARRTKRETTGTSDALAAQKIFAEWLTDPSLQYPTRLDRLTVEHVLDDYYREHVAENVIDKLRAEIAIGHLKAFFGKTPLCDVDIPASRRYRDARRAGQIGGGERRENKVGSDATIRRELVVLLAAANHARRWKRIKPDEMPSVEKPTEAPRAEEAAWLTHDELRKAIDEAPTLRLRRFIRIGYYTAARRASIERLTKFQIDLKAGRINLRSPTEDALQRNSKKRRPIIPIHSEIRPDIEQLFDESPNEFLWGDCADMYRPFNEHLTAIGLAAKSFPHILRHTRATHLLSQGVSLWDVAKLLGDTVKTVERVYGHAIPDNMAAAMEGVG